MKNIVICCDGTGNEYGDNNTNVVETYAVSVKDDEQIAYYDPGVGTGGWEYDEGSGSLRAKGDLVTGNGLQNNVEQAYRFLMQTYEAGDRLYLFGFSRGAFTVRSLAGMLNKCGLLSPTDDNLIEYAGKVYNKNRNAKMANGFRRMFGRPCPVHFIGVWDTVESLALNAGKKFHDAKLNARVKFAYHALAIDEKRRDFPHLAWDERNVRAGQTIEQVWFAGVHSDVGGWYDERGLANISLRWMINKATDCDMRVYDEKLAEFVPNPHDQMHESYEGVWRIRGRAVREIPAGAKVHASVTERLAKRSNRYEPKNLPSRYVTVD